MITNSRTSPMMMEPPIPKHSLQEHLTSSLGSSSSYSGHQFPFVFRIKFADMIFPCRKASDFTLRMSGIVSFCGHAQFEGLNFPGQLINKRGNILGCIIAVGE